jgi:uncharacterized protein (TIGR02145 family)
MKSFKIMMMKGYILLLSGLAFIVFTNQAQTVTDYDGNGYDTLTIGTQVWLKQNLRTTHFDDGTYIPFVTDSMEWTHIESMARCYYHNDSTAYDTLYGALYNGYIMNYDKNICPVGWHISTNEEWQKVEIFLGGTDNAGGKMKEAGTDHWTAPNTGATNSSGFTGLPGGMRDLLSVYVAMGENGLWWTTSAYDASTFWSTYLWYMYSGVDHNPTPKNYGLSIRCVRNAVSGLDNIGTDREINLYPNPAFNKFVVDYSGNEVLHVQLYNLTGACVLQREINHSSNEIDLGQLSDGIYVVMIRTAGWTLQKKLIKQ